MNNSQLDFGPLRSKTAPEATPLPGARKELPKYPFVMSYPDTANLPIMEAHTAMGEALAEVGSTAVRLSRYGQGYPPLREFIAQRLGERRSMSVDPDDILLTEGSGQAIHFVTEALVDPSDVVIVDDFVYGGTLWSLRRFGADIRGVVSDADGMVPDALVEALHQVDSRRQAGEDDTISYPHSKIPRRGRCPSSAAVRSWRWPHGRGYRYSKTTASRSSVSRATTCRRLPRSTTPRW